MNKYQLCVNRIISIAQNEKCYDGKNILGEIKENCYDRNMKKKKYFCLIFDGITAESVSTNSDIVLQQNTQLAKNQKM